MKLEILGERVSIAGRTEFGAAARNKPRWHKKLIALAKALSLLVPAVVALYKEWKNRREEAVVPSTSPPSAPTQPQRIPSPSEISL